MHDMNSSLGSNCSKPKNNSVYSTVLIFHKHYNGWKSFSIRQIFATAHNQKGEITESELAESSQKTLSIISNQQSVIGQSLNIEMANSSFFSFYLADNGERSFSASNSLKKLSKGSFSNGSQNSSEFFDKTQYKFQRKLVFSLNSSQETVSPNKKRKVAGEPLEDSFSNNGKNSIRSLKSSSSSISLDFQLPLKSKNVLSFLFSVFVSDSQVVGIKGFENNISPVSFQKTPLGVVHYPFQKFSSDFFQKLWGRAQMEGPLRRSLSVGGGVLPRNRFIYQGKNKNQFFPFLILFYLVCLGFKGSKEKFCLHEQRISFPIVSTNVLNSKNAIEKNLRFSEYSPIKKSGTLEAETKSISSMSLWGFARGVSTPIANSNQRVFVNLQVEKLLRYSVHISTQFFVFFLVQNLISENNFGRHNPLRQKDSKANQARILWPRKSHWFQFKKKSVVGNSLPGIQDISTLLEILIQSLKGAPNSSGGFAPTSRLGPASRDPVGPKGYLFVGPPGTGKTLLAQEIAQLAEVPFICVSASEIQKQIEIGTRIGALRLRKLFQQAQRLSPCILFFDEIDAIAQRQSQHDSKLFTEFLIQMDSWGGGGSGQKSVERKNITHNFANGRHSVILGTTNYLDRLDSAFVRSGRFDRILALNYPAKKIRFDILTFYIKKQNSSDDLNVKSLGIKKGSVNNTPQDLSLKTSSKVFLGTHIGLNYLSFVTEGFSQAHLAKLVNESLLFTISQNDILLKNNTGKFFNRNDSLTKHSFISLLHGLKQMLIHRKNLPYQNIDVVN